MSTLRFEAEYMGGANYPEVLAATTVNVGASLTISLQRVKTLTASVIESAALRKAETKVLSSSTTVTPSLLHGLAFFKSMNATPVSETATSPQITRGHIFNATVSEGAHLNSARTARLVTNPVAMTASLKRNNVRLLTPAAISIAAALSKHQTLFRTLPVLLAETATLNTRRARRVTLSVVVNEHVVSLLGVPTKYLVTTPTTVLAGLNKKGKYHAPPAVLQMYDLVDPYQLPGLKGATVSYINGIFGSGVMFDIYAAYVLSGGSFYVADNGLKQALDQHPAVARVF